MTAQRYRHRRLRKRSPRVIVTTREPITAEMVAALRREWSRACRSNGVLLVDGTTLHVEVTRP